MINAFSTSGPVQITEDNSFPLFRIERSNILTRPGNVIIKDLGSGKSSCVLAFAKFESQSNAVDQLLGTALLQKVGIPVAHLYVRPLFDGKSLVSSTKIVRFGRDTIISNAGKEVMDRAAQFSLEIPRNILKTFRIMPQTLDEIRRDGVIDTPQAIVLSVQPVEQILKCGDAMTDREREGKSPHRINFDRAEKFFSQNPVSAAQIVCSGLITSDGDHGENQIVYSADFTKCVRIDVNPNRLPFLHHCRQRYLTVGNKKILYPVNRNLASHLDYFRMVSCFAHVGVIQDIMKKAEAVLTKEAIMHMPIEMGLEIDGVKLYNEKMLKKIASRVVYNIAHYKGLIHKRSRFIYEGVMNG